MNEIALSGRSEAKGRNGYFRPTRLRAAFYQTRPETPITLEVRSKRDADTPPLVLDMTRDDARALVEAVQMALVDASLAAEYPEYAERLANHGTIGADSCYKCAGTPEANRTAYGHLELDPEHGTVLAPHVRSFEAGLEGRCRWCDRERASHDQRLDLPGAPLLCLTGWAPR